MKGGEREGVERETEDFGDDDAANFRQSQLKLLKYVDHIQIIELIHLKSKMIENTLNYTSNELNIV